MPFKSHEAIGCSRKKRTRFEIAVDTATSKKYGSSCKPWYDLGLRYTQLLAFYARAFVHLGAPDRAGRMHSQHSARHYIADPQSDF